MAGEEGGVSSPLSILRAAVQNGKAKTMQGPDDERPATAPTGSRTYAAIQNPKPEAIVIYCSDPRFQPAFREFIQKELGLAEGQYIPLVIGGGAGVLAHRDQLPKDFKVLKDRLEMHLARFSSIRRVVLINHEDCQYYETLRDKLPHLFSAHLGGASDKQRRDLGTVATALLGLLSSKLGMELYYARFQDPEHTRIVFERVGG
jgi:hypothetical protein